jgi:hypothetical protein
MSKNTIIGLILVAIGVLCMLFLGLAGLIIGIILALGGVAVFVLGYLARRSASS